MTKANDLASLLDANGDVVSSALNNVPSADFVNDTTPQLGGTLDTNGNDINFGDNDKAIFGAGSDLEISHNGTENVIDSNAGTLVLRSAGAGTIELRDQGSQVLAQFNDNADAKLYYNNNLKIATTATGVDVTGGFTATEPSTIETADNSTQLTLSSTHTNAAEGPRLDLRRNSASPADNDAIGTIRFLGQDSAAANIVFAEIQTLVQDVTAGTQDANMQLLVRRNGSLTEGLSMSSSDTVFNEAGNDIDFRIESSLQSNAFFVNGGNSNVGINRAPSYELDVGAGNNANSEMRIIAGTDSGADAVLRIQCQATAGTRDSAIYFGDSANGSIGRIVYGHSNDDFRIFTNGSERVRLTSGGNLLINRTAANSDSLLGIKAKSTARIIDTQSFSTALQYHHTFLNSSASLVGAISVSTSSTSYNTSSDYRLKTAVTYDWDATSRLKQLRPARFEWIADGDDAVPVDGFLAHEVQDVVPEAITGTKDAMRDEEYEVTPAVFDEDGNEVTPAVMGTRSVPDYQGIDQSKLTPLLTKALIEAVEKIEQLEARIAALETA